MKNGNWIIDLFNTMGHQQKNSIHDFCFASCKPLIKRHATDMSLIKGALYTMLICCLVSKRQVSTCRKNREKVEVVCSQHPDPKMLYLFAIALPNQEALYK